MYKVTIYYFNGEVEEFKAKTDSRIHGDVYVWDDLNGDIITVPLFQVKKIMEKYYE